MDKVIQVTLIWILYLYLFYKEFFVKNPIKNELSQYLPIEVKILVLIKVVGFLLIPIGLTLWFYTHSLLSYPVLFIVAGGILYYLPSVFKKFDKVKAIL